LSPRNLLALAAVSTAVFFTCTGPASAAPKAPAPVASPDGDGPPSPGTPVAYDTFVKNAQLQDGLFPVIRKEGKLYLVVAGDQLDKDFYEHATTANGLGGFGILSGDDFQLLVRVVRFHRINDRQVAIQLPQDRFRARPGTAAAEAVARSTTDSVQAVTGIAAEDKAGGKLVIDGSFLLADVLDIGNTLSDIVNNPKNPLGSYHQDPSRSYFGDSKAFPENDIIETHQTFESAKPDTIDTVVDPHSIDMRVTYNFALLRGSPDYVPRLADDRVGFWTDPHVNFDRDDSYDDLQRFITRWNIKASDPTRPSPAIKPVVYTLTNTIPPEYKPAIREALLEWNKAFERIGILDAVKVQDQPDDPNFDPDDIRYNPVRWLTEANGGGFAEAQIEWDPRTGEIFRSGILIDADIMRYGKFEFSDVVGPASGAPTSFGPLAPGASATAADENVRRPRSFLHRDTGAREQAQFGALALGLYGAEVPPSYTHDFLKSIVLHESGHDFGLAHNFIGHNAYTAAELRSKSFTEANGVASSVMEYAPTNLWPKDSPHGDYFQTTLGPYDYHAIHWGYAPIPGSKTPDDEVATLNAWAGAATDPKFAFASDEDVEYDGHAVDPRIAQWMLTGDGVGWCQTQLGIDRNLMQTLDARYPRPQMPWDQERFAFALLAGEYERCTLAMTHYIAGEHLSRARRGDPHAPQPLTPVSRDEEYRAFKNLDTYLFSDSAWDISSTTLRRLVYSEYESFLAFGYDPKPRHDISLTAFVANEQNAALAYMFDPLVLARLEDLPSKSGSLYHPMTLADLFTWTQSSVFGDLQRGRPATTTLHHNLQRSFARVLEALAVAPEAGTPYDAQALARHELTSLAGNVRGSLRRTDLDLATRAHLEALRDEIERTLDTRNVIPLRS
jgi:hypothetical protein